jgi:hypothetical protein
VGASLLDLLLASVLLHCELEPDYRKRDRYG